MMITSFFDSEKSYTPGNLDINSPPMNNSSNPPARHDTSIIVWQDREEIALHPKIDSYTLENSTKI
jgi:hypothetical protein